MIQGLLELQELLVLWLNCWKRKHLWLWNAVYWVTSALCYLFSVCAWPRSDALSPSVLTEGETDWISSMFWLHENNCTVPNGFFLFFFLKTTRHGVVFVKDKCTIVSHFISLETLRCHSNCWFEVITMPRRPSISSYFSFRRSGNVQPCTIRRWRCRAAHPIIWSPHVLSSL